MKHLWILSLAALFLGCSRAPTTGPGEIRWDRDVCVRCAMVISDRHYGAQVRGGDPSGETELHKFDDLGCAIEWLNNQSWPSDPRTEVWVNDQVDGAWLDAQTSYYDRGRITPMDYGLGARTSPSEETINYSQAVSHIMQDRLRKQGPSP